MTDRGRRLIAAVVTNGAAGLAGFGGAWLTGLRLPWSILAAVVCGTIGWLLGAWLAAGLRRWLRERSYAPSGRAHYRLAELPPGEHTAGGKARSLGAMIQAGLPVPDGVVLLPASFAGDQLTEGAAQWLAGELNRLGHDRQFAVRSSALAEDSANASFAGAYESVLDVPADQVATALATVRASGRAHRVAAYAAARGADDAGQVAVVVQLMVPAQRAGVLFTVHPLTRELDTMLGNAVAGLVVSPWSAGPPRPPSSPCSAPTAATTAPTNCVRSAPGCTPSGIRSRWSSAEFRKTSSGRSPTARCGCCRPVRSPP